MPKQKDPLFEKLDQLKDDQKELIKQWAKSQKAGEDPDPDLLDEIQKMGDRIKKIEEKLEIKNEPPKEPGKDEPPKESKSWIEEFFSL